MADDKESENERRREPRTLSCIPVSIKNEAESHVALIRDISTTGARLLLREELAVGTTVLLELFLGEAADVSRPAQGKVVRSERFAGARDLWSWESAVAFDESIDDYADEIEAMAARQRSIGVLK